MRQKTSVLTKEKLTSLILCKKVNDVAEVTKDKSTNANKHFLYYVFKKDKDLHLMPSSKYRNVRYILKGEYKIKDLINEGEKGYGKR